MSQGFATDVLDEVCRLCRIPNLYVFCNKDLLPQLLFLRATANNPPMDPVKAPVQQKSAGIHRQIHALLPGDPATGDQVDPILGETLYSRLFCLLQNPRHIRHIVDGNDFFCISGSEFPHLSGNKFGNGYDMATPIIGDLIVILPAHGSVVVEHQIFLRPDAPDSRFRCPVGIDHTGIELLVLQISPDIADVQPVLHPFDGRHRPHHGPVQAGGTGRRLRQVIQPGPAVGPRKADPFMPIRYQQAYLLRKPGCHGLVIA